eukprot:TRINITY_DN8759_c0_g1_i1.p1 TRINITY_DN8759_c0_g1~~TRINITY_DN8759_c0_g1_i1.p1  ORF type:complete len:392 (+),score=115.80 TRINITY_DN8759_c0_g1_i1:357-1532(+)
MRERVLWAKPVELADTLPEFMQGGVRCEWLRVSEPKGVVLNIAPWNAPVLLSILPAMGAIAAGNTVVIKPPDATPRTSALLKQLVAEACPKTAVAVVEGGVEAVNSLIDSNVDHIMFTGGTSIGRVIMARAAQTLTPVTLELGGKNPVMIDEMGDRLLAAAVKEIVGVKTFFSGEFCQAHDYCLVVEGMWERFTTALAAAIEELGPARLRPIIHRRHYDRVKHMLLTHTGTNAPSEVECDDGGMRVPVTAVLQPGVGDAVMQDEVFGPVVSVVKVESVDAAAEYVQSLPTGTPLLSYYYGESGERADQWMLQTSSGSLAINAGPMRMQSNLHAGIVGVGNSGLGGCSIWGEQTFRTFSHTRHVVRAKAGGFAGSVWGPGPVPAAEGSEIDL